jgi:tripartite-type tricarboxylate transporter receptor subunit TctC
MNPSSILPRRRLLAAGFAALASLGALTALPALASDAFPNKPIKLIVPFPPGGQTDALGRAIGHYIGKELGQPVIVDNKPGANTHIGLQQLLADPADGYSVLVGGAPSFIQNPLLMKNVHYNPKTDIQLLVPVSDMPMMMVVPTNHPAKSVQEFIALAKASPGKLTFGSTGTGGSVHLSTELFEQVAKVDLTHVPYKGSAPAMTDLLTGRIDVMFDGPTTSLPQVKAGKLRLLGITSKDKAPFVPDAAPIADSLPGYQSTLWFGLITRKGVPDEAAQKIKAAMDKALLDPAFQKQVQDLGNLPRKPMTAQQIDGFLSAEGKRWGDLIKSRNIQVE